MDNPMNTTRRAARQAEVVAALRPALDAVFPDSGPCGLCDDTVLGQRHRLVEIIAERIRSGEPWEDVVADWGYTAEHAILALAVTSC